MASTFLYDLDLSGTQPGNKIIDEKHVIVKPTQITQASFVVLRACPFYADSIVVKDAKGSTGRILVKGQDYILTHQSVALSKLTKLKVYASITLIDRNYTGDIYVTYQTVGGEYVPNDYTIVEKLTREKFQLRKTSFDQIVGLPSSYPNPPHQHNPTDMVGLTKLVESMQDLAAVLRGLQGSYGTLNTIVDTHLKASTAHVPSQVGLSLIRNYDVAIVPDLDNRATDRYLTPVVVADWVNGKLNALKADNLNTFLTQANAASFYLDKQTAYTKDEVKNLFFDKNYTEANFLRKQDALTETNVGNLIHQIVDLSQYHTRNEAYSLFYTKDQADTRYYTKTQTDNKFISVTQGDARYIQTTTPANIIANVPDNTITVRDNKFYTGLQAPADVYELYIDCINGSDNNPGTRDNPLKTISRANEITPTNKSSTWFLRHYTLDQMVRAATSYEWDFNTVVRSTAKRTISLYAHTWIDGAKASQARQTGNGNFDWRYVNEVERLPVYLRIKITDDKKLQKLYGIDLQTHGQIEFNGISLIKPFSVGIEYTSTNNTTDTCFIKGCGEVLFNGCYLLTSGDYNEKSTHYYSWTMCDTFQQLNVLYNGSAFGFCQEIITNGISGLKLDFNTVFNFSSSNYQFKYYNARGSIFVVDGISPTDAAKANGATNIVNNMKTVLQRPGMFYGLNFVNGVCTNLLYNFNINPN